MKRAHVLVLMCLASVVVATLLSAMPKDEGNRNDPATVTKGGGRPVSPVYFSPMHIVLSPDGGSGYVVNQTASSISVLDLHERRARSEIPVGPNPTHAVLSPDGATLYVSCRFGERVDVVDLKGHRVNRSIPTGFEPYGLALSADGGTLFVANSMSDTVSFIDTHTDETRRTVPVGRSPRFIALIPDGTRLVVGNALSRNVSFVDTSGDEVETRSLGRASMLRDVAVSPDGRWAYVAQLVSHDEQATLQMERGWINSNGVGFVDLQQPDHYATMLLDRVLQGAANPWGVAMSADQTRLYVTLAGIHEVAIIDLEKAHRVVAETQTPAQVKRLSEDVEVAEQQAIARRVPAHGLGPRGIALSEAAGELYVVNHFSEDVSVLDADSGALLATIPLGPRQAMTEWRRGELLFNDARLCFQNWYSCASCHEEDGGMDGLNWDLANDGLGNPKNAKLLRNVHETWPSMWRGVRADMNAATAAGQRFLGFLPEADQHRALMTFLGNPPRPPNPHRGRDPEAEARGMRVFAQARCNVCHPAPTYTDGRKHDLGLVGRVDLGSRFVTPALHEAYRSAPYLHDGRAPTLRAIFTDHNPDDRHGRTQGLTAGELDDLLVYLRSL